jgi:hypothetical protein
LTEELRARADAVPEVRRPIAGDGLHNGPPEMSPGGTIRSKYSLLIGCGTLRHVWKLPERMGPA